jgi:hypothetical protein
MNERIKELLEQAYDEAVPETWTTLSSEQLGRIYEKFAELIVQECAEVVQEGRWMVPPSQHQLARSIKQHFGVEE